MEPTAQRAGRAGLWQARRIVALAFTVLFVLFVLQNPAMVTPQLVFDITALLFAFPLAASRSARW